MTKRAENNEEKRSQSIAGGESIVRSAAELEAELARVNSLLDDTQEQTKTAYWEYIPATEKITWSNFVYHLLGYDRKIDKPSNEAFDKVLHPDDFERFQEMRGKLISQDMPNGFEFRVVVDQKIKHLKMTAVSERDETGLISRIIGTTQDITELKMNEERLRKINLFAKDLMDLSSEHDLIWYVVKQVVSELDLEDCVIYLVDENTDMLVQSAVYGIKNISGEDVINALSIKIGEGNTGYVAQTKTPLIVEDVSKDKRYISDIPGMGSEICVPIIHEGHLYGVIDCEHAAVGFFNQGHLGLLNTIATLLATKLGQWDILNKIQASELQYSEAQRIAHIGSWEWNINTDSINWSNEIYNILGLNPAEVNVDYKAFNKAIYPDDLDAVHKSIEAAIRGEKLPYDSEFRIIRPNGAIRHVHALGEVFFDDNNKVFKVSGSMMDITSRKKAEVALNKAVNDAKLANQAKSDFLATMSHELRTPLNAIIGFSEMMTSQVFGNLGSEKYLSYAHDIHYSSQHLLSLVNSILDLSALTANKYNLVKCDVNVDEIIESCKTITKRLSEEKSIKCTYNVDEKISTIYADPGSLTQILLNL